MNLQTYTSSRAICPGCGAPLSLKTDMILVTCNYCGCDSKVIRHLRKVEPDFFQSVKPEAKGKTGKDYSFWNSEQLLYGILNETDLEKRILMAKALNEWAHVNHNTARFIPLIVETMINAEPELDKKLSGILGKFICHDDIKLKRQVILAGEKYGYAGSKGLLFALSLGDEGTVKLLLDIGEKASVSEREDYTREALFAVQTAIGRISDRKQLKIAMEILLYRLVYVTGIVQDWILRFLRNHFDIGYTFLFSSVLELIEDCVTEAPYLVSGLSSALRECRRAKNREELLERLETIKKLKTEAAKVIACEVFGTVSNDLEEDDIKLAIDVFLPLFENPVTKEPAGKALKGFLWSRDEIAVPLKELYENNKEELPECFIYDYELKSGQ